MEGGKGTLIWLASSCKWRTPPFSSRRSSSPFTPSGKAAELPASSAYKRRQDNCDFIDWRKKRSGQPELPSTHVLDAARACDQHDKIRLQFP